MTEPPITTCPRCGSSIPADSPEGLCLLCLIREGAARYQARSGPTPHLPPRFGDYDILAEVARGGMGTVYRARQLSLDRTVALKVISTGRSAPAKVVARFRNEVEAAASLDHANIVSIYEVGDFEGWEYFSMQFVEGRTLRQELASGPVPFVRAARLLATVASAIQHAHERGVLHRDLKPGNILIDLAGEPHVTDFGLAKITGRDSDLTASNTALGTPAYMSPEQAAGRGKSITIAADIYGLGAVLFEMLTSRPPFQGETPMATVRCIIEQEPPLPRSLNPAVPSDLAIICLKCLEKDPARRYATADALAQDLQRWLRHEPILARPASPWKHAAKWVRRRPMHAALAGTVALALAASGAGLLWHYRRLHSAQRATAAANQRLAAHLRQVEWQQAEDLAAAGRTPDALAVFARFLRETPGDRLVAFRLLSLLELRAFSLPALAPLVHGLPVTVAQLDAKGRRLFTVAEDFVLRSWNLENGEMERESRLQFICKELKLFPDGERMLTATRNGRVVIWDLPNWQPERELGTIASWNRNVSLSSDGRWVASVNPLGQVELWETATGRLFSRTNLPVAAYRLSSALGPEGETVIQGTPTGLWVWRPGPGELSNLLATNEAPIFSVCDWTRRRVIASLDPRQGATSGLVSLDLDSGREIARNANTMDWTTLALDPQGTRLLVHRWGTGISVLDPETLATRVEPFAAVRMNARVATDRDFRVVYHASLDGTGRLFDLNSGKPLSETIEHQGGILSHQLSPDGNWLVTASQDGTARLWDLRMRASDAVFIRETNKVFGLGLSPDGQRVAVASANQARLYEVATGKPLTPPLPSREPTYRVQFSPDGRFIATTTWDRIARLWNAATGQPHGAAWKHNRRVWMAVFSPNGRLVATASEDSQARVFDTVTGDLQFPPIHHEDEVIDVSFSPDNSLLATASVDATARLWNAQTGAAVGPVLRHHGVIWTARFSPDGARLVTASNDRTAQVWDVRTGLPAAPAIRSDQGVLSAQFSPDGCRILVGTGGGARIFDARSSEPLTLPMRHSNRVWIARFSPDARWVATASEDRTARVWDAQTGYPVTEPLVHQGEVTCITWLPDSRRLLTGSHDGTVRLWKLPEMDRVPSWLPDLAEALAGKRDDGRGGQIAVSTDALNHLRLFVEQLPEETPENRWLRWFLVERLQPATP